MVCADCKAWEEKYLKCYESLGHVQRGWDAELQASKDARERHEKEVAGLKAGHALAIESVKRTAAVEVLKCQHRTQDVEIAAARAAEIAQAGA